ncbi:MAG: BamA/TamA family outer membrane protein, partial [Rickettsiales bacterium]|nr:BamA/TamA family outer membrane protein [Rickettsiales bacterium]
SENDNRGNSAINIGYNDNSFGSSVFFNFTVTEYLLQTLKYTYSVEKLDNISDDYENILTDKKQKISEISVALSYDRRDNIHYPTKGYVLSYTFDFAGLIGTKDYLRNTLYFAHYYPIYTDVIVMKFEVKLANITSVNSNPLYPNDGFYLGGYSMRGFESAGIGPRVGANGNTVSSSYGVGGTRLYYSNLEIKFPLLKPRELNLYGIFFINAGTVTGVEKNPNVDRSLILDSGSIRSAAGFSIMWQTPMGNLNLDFSKVLKKETYDLGENFMFNIGKNF